MTHAWVTYASRAGYVHGLGQAFWMARHTLGVLHELPGLAGREGAREDTGQRPPSRRRAVTTVRGHPPEVAGDTDHLSQKVTAVLGTSPSVGDLGPPCDGINWFPTGSLLLPSRNKHARLVRKRNASPAFSCGRDVGALGQASQPEATREQALGGGPPLSRSWVVTGRWGQGLTLDQHSRETEKHRFSLLGGRH